MKLLRLLNPFPTIWTDLHAAVASYIRQSLSCSELSSLVGKKFPPYNLDSEMLYKAYLPLTTSLALALRW